MRFSIVFCLLVSQTSALFFGAIGGAFGTVKSSVGKFFSDVGKDLLDTYDCTVHEIEKVFYNESQISEYYKKCKENEAQEKNLITAEKIETQKTITLVFKSGSESRKGSAATNDSLTQKLESVEALLREHYAQVNNLTTNLDHELKSLSKNVDVELKKIENDNEVAMEKCLHKIENEFRHYKETNNKDNKNEILRVLEEIMKSLNKYTNQKDSELKKEMEVLVAAIERNSTNTILEELEKWKEKVIQQTKDVSYDRYRNATSTSQNMPKSFKELFMKISNETSDNNVKTNGNTLGSIETATIVKVIGQINDKPMTGSTIIIQKNETIANNRAITKLEININPTLISSTDVNRQKTINESDNKEKVKSISCGAVTKNQTTDLVESTTKLNCTPVMGQPSLSTSLVSAKKNENIIDHQESSLIISTPSPNDEREMPATFNILKDTKDSTESPLSATPSNVLIMEHTKPLTPTSVIDKKYYVTDQNIVETTTSVIFSEDNQTTKSGSSVNTMTDAQHTTEPPALTTTKLYSTTNDVITYYDLTTTLPTTPKLVTENPIVSTTASTLSTVLPKNGEVTVAPTMSSTIKNNEKQTTLPALSTSTTDTYNGQTTEQTEIYVAVDSKQTIVSPVESEMISTALNSLKSVTENPAVSTTASIISTVSPNNEVATDASIISATTENIEKTTAQPELATSTTATSNKQAIELRDVSVALDSKQITVRPIESEMISTTLNSIKNVTEEPIVSTTASILSTASPNNEVATVTQTISSNIENIEKTTAEPEITTSTTATNNNQTAEQHGVYVAIDSKQTTVSPVESDTVSTTLNINNVPEEPIVSTTAGTFSTVSRRNGKATVTPTTSTTTMTINNSEKMTVRPVLSTSTVTDTSQTIDKSGVAAVIYSEQTTESHIESAMVSTTTDQPMASSAIDHNMRTTQMTDSIAVSTQSNRQTEKPVASTKLLNIVTNNTLEKNGTPDSRSYSTQANDEQTTGQPPVLTTLLTSETKTSKQTTSIILESSQFSTKSSYEQVTGEPGVTSTSTTNSEQTTNKTTESLQLTNSKSHNDNFGNPSVSTTVSYSIANHEQATDVMELTLLSTQPNYYDHTTEKPASITTGNEQTTVLFQSNHQQTGEHAALSTTASAFLAYNKATAENVLESPLNMTQFNYDQTTELPATTTKVPTSATLSSTGLGKDFYRDPSILSTQTISEQTTDRSTMILTDDITDSSLLSNLYKAQITEPTLTTAIEQSRHKSLELSLSDRGLTTEKTLELSSSNESVQSTEQSLETVSSLTNKDLTKDEPSIMSSLERGTDQTSIISSVNNKDPKTDQSFESILSSTDTDLPIYETSIIPSQRNEDKLSDQSLESISPFTNDNGETSDESRSNNSTSSITNEEQITDQFQESPIPSSMIVKPTSSSEDEKQTSSSLTDEQQISSSLKDEEVALSSITNEEQTSFALINKQKAPISLTNDEQTPYTFIDEEQALSSITDDEQNSAALIDEEQTSNSLQDEQPQPTLITNDELTSPALIDEERTPSIKNDDEASSAVIDEDQSFSTTDDEQNSPALIDEQQTSASLKHELSAITNDEQTSSALINEEQTLISVTDEKQDTSLTDEDNTLSSLWDAEQTSSSVRDKEHTSYITDIEKTMSSIKNDPTSSSIIDEEKTSQITDHKETMDQSLESSSEPIQEVDLLPDSSNEPSLISSQTNEEQTSVIDNESMNQPKESNIMTVTDKKPTIDESSETIISSSPTKEKQQDQFSDSIISSTSMPKEERIPHEPIFESTHFSKSVRKNRTVSADSEISSTNKTNYQHTTHKYEQTKNVASSTSSTDQQLLNRIAKSETNEATAKPEYTEAARKSAHGTDTEEQALKKYGKWLNEFPISDKIATDEAKRLIDESIKAKTIMDNIFSDTSETTNLFDNPDYMK